MANEGGSPCRFRLRGDFDAGKAACCLAKKTKDGPQARRLLALAAIYDGASRTEAAKIGGVTLQIVRDWVVKFNARGPDGLIDRKAPGQPSRLNDAHRQALVQMIESGPIPAIHGVVRWRLVDLCQWMFEEFRITVAKQTLSRELRAMGYRKLSARPRHHAQAEGAIEDFKKASPPAWRNRARQGDRSATHRGLVRRRGPHRPEEQDHPALGQARHPPGAPRDQRTASTYIFGAICPKQGKGAALVMPPCNSEAMNLHLAEIARKVAPGRTRRAHSSTRPDGICPAASSCRPTSPSSRCRQNAPSSTRSKTSGSSCATTGSPTASSNPTTTSLDHCCEAWNKLVDQPWRIMSIGLREWAHGF